MLELALVENVQRADLNPLEEAAAYYSLVEEFGLTQEIVAARVGKSRVAVANSLRLLRLPDVAKEAVVRGQIREGHARALLGLADDALIEQALVIVIDNEITVRQTEELVRRMQQAASEPAANDTASEEDDSPETHELETRLRDGAGYQSQPLPQPSRRPHCDPLLLGRRTGVDLRHAGRAERFVAGEAREPRIDRKIGSEFGSPRFPLNPRFSRFC